MSYLRVNNRILRYKGITYQISQIASKKMVYVKRENKIEYTSLEPLKWTLPLMIIASLIGLVALLKGSMIGIVFILIGVGAGLYSKSLWEERSRQNRLDKYTQLYGLSLRMSNGDDPIFISNNREMIKKVDQAVEDAMNGTDGVSISFDNVNIEILDSDNVNIGGVIKE